MLLFLFTHKWLTSKLSKMLLFLFTHKWLTSKLSNAILTLKYFLSVSHVNGVKQLLQMSHGLCVTKCNAEQN